MRCSKCETNNPLGNNFCARCGSALIGLCPVCGAESPPTSNFCGRCGAPLKATGAHGVQASPKQYRGDGERRHLTVLFSDLVGSTEISTRLDPEEFRELVAGYHHAAGEAITRFGGYVAKYLGDGIMAYFGWPEAHDNDAERAARGGLAIVEGVAELNSNQGRTNRHTLSVRVGIDSGTVVIGRGGSNDAEVFGDTANIAARVQSAAEPDTVLVTPAVNRLVSGLFVVEERGEHQLKGIAEPVELYRIVRPSGARSRLSGTRGRGLTPFVGRKNEMTLLWDCWERTNEGEGQVVVIAGEAGIGKSRLVRQFRRRLKGTAHTWTECSGASHFQNTPFYPITDMLQQGFVQRGETNEEKLRELEVDLEHAGLNLSETVPLIAPLLNLQVDDKYVPLKLSPQQQRVRLIDALAAWMFGGARTQPVVMAAEDLHWFDASTLELMESLVEQGATSRVLLLLTGRPEFRTPWTPREHHSRMTLDRLSADDVREIVVQVVAQNSISAETVERVVERTGGVPLFAEELTRAVLERGDAKPEAREIPHTLHDSLMARLDRLGPAKEVAQVAAVIGREFSHELLQAMLPMLEDELTSALTNLAEAELIYAYNISQEATYSFKHALIQDAAYEALLKTRRRELHRKVATAITDRFAAMAEAQPEVLARHWTDAAEAVPAIAAWRKAGDAAFLRYACKETEASYRHALDLIRTLPESRERDEQELELMNRFVPVLQLTRGWAAPEATEAIERSQALAERTDNLAQLLLQVVGSFVGCFSRGDVLATGPLANQVFDLAQREGTPPVLGLGRVIKLSSCYLQGDLRGAEEHYIAGSGLFMCAGERFPSTIGSGFGFGSHVAWLLGHADTARERIRQAVAGATEIGSPFELAYAQHLAAMLRLFLREFGDARIAAAQSVALSEEHGFHQYAAGSRVFMGLAEAALGRLGDGLPKINLGLAGLNESGAGVMMTLYLCWLAIAQSLEGKVSEALHTIEKALQANPEELGWRPDVIRMRGEMRRRLGQTDGAEADFREAFALARDIGAKAWELRAATSLARLLREQGKRDEARAMLADIHNWFTEGFDTADLKEAKAVLAEVDA
jgi:class 3 adenylate cyclase/tetratricopeptide (TPR) repeat protein